MPGEESLWDTIIIGCGMSGLAAGIRIALDGKQVLILERHNAPGGLNGFYFQAGRKFDVGLHAVTNYLGPGQKGPLSKLFRQLRLPRDAFRLSPQMGSRIAFPGVDLRFSNAFEELESSVADAFPRQVDAFRRLRGAVLDWNALDLEAPDVSSRAVLSEYLDDPVLQDMILCPLMYYGSAWEHDMDFSQFVTLWRAIFEEGFGRPYEGVRLIIRALLDKYRELGGQRRMKCGVKALHTEGGKVARVELETGEVLRARRVISTIGGPETAALTGMEVGGPAVGRLSFTETISVLDRAPRDLGMEETIVFFNASERFAYEQASDAVDLRSGVICCPNNYQYEAGQTLPEGWLRVTALANYGHWKGFDDAVYTSQKAAWFPRIVEAAANFLPGVELSTIQAHTVHEDMFTPRTIEHYTGHFGGAVYGSGDKSRTGSTPYENLYLAGTDQGFLGIVGAMLSGISVANLYVVGAD